MVNVEINTHISGRFNLELENLTNSVLSMAGEVEEQLRNALLALKDNDPGMAEKVILNDLQVNNMEMQIDEECMRIIAKRHPTASDLRLVMTISKAIAEIERIGDAIERIARTIAKQQLPASDQIKSSMLVIGEHVTDMLRGTFDAFARMDMKSALSVHKQDLQIDADYKRLIAQIIVEMRENREQLANWLEVLWAVRAFERIGDICKNLCEYVVYLAQGRDVHLSPLESLQEKLQGLG